MRDYKDPLDFIVPYMYPPAMYLLPHGNLDGQFEKEFPEIDPKTKEIVMERILAKLMELHPFQF